MPAPRSAIARCSLRAGPYPHWSTTTMRRNTLPLLVGAVAALAVACRDSTVAPARNSNSLSASASPLNSASGSNQNRTLLGTIELSPNGGTYHVGDFDVVIPAGAVCDPTTAKYGAKHWDQDCKPANRSITVQVIAQRHGQDVSVDFQPDLRFRPSAGWAVIQTRAYSTLLTSSSIRQLTPNSPFFQNFAILYVPTGSSSRIDEVLSTGDPSMVTHVDLRTGVVWRRVKHFSGYLVVTGTNCGVTATGSPDPSCTTLGGVGDPGTVGTSSLVNGALVFSVVVTPSDSTVVPPNDSTSTP